VRLEVPASAVGLEGTSVTGMAFSLYDGTATWDATGVTTVPSSLIGLPYPDVIHGVRETGRETGRKGAGPTATPAGKRARDVHER
jgi:hypothetical protein